MQRVTLWVANHLRECIKMFTEEDYNNYLFWYSLLGHLATNADDRLAENLKNKDYILMPLDLLTIDDWHFTIVNIGMHFPNSKSESISYSKIAERVRF